MASYRDQTHKGFFLWLDDGYFETWESGVWELKYSLKSQDSDKIELTFRRTTKQQYEDSAEDFLCEASTMTQVYANAFCTFSTAVVDERNKLDTWYSFVDQFMRLGLSLERDRLLAISGTARFLFSLGDKRLPDGSYAIIDPKIERKFGQSVEYFAGLKRTHWIAHLLWYPDLGGCTAMKSASTLRQKPDPESFKRCPDDSVPSWSWAACPGPIQWTFLNYNRPRTGEVPKRDGGPLACLRKNHFEPLGSDAYGLPKSASLDISCLLIQAKYTELDGPEDVQKRLEKSVDHVTNQCFEWYTMASSFH
ncbi:hypothetical protein FAUST_10930 [Fusarium austroamericanum]|uniref:Uncharacterized protein n=1 Tax=Fusarium austroamericanum TaxID=282268 RepID=A0AAN6BVM3_FUSAU|nr:hypothetical protein FAUST_10930 [Fusarium austroamericanum]